MVLLWHSVFQISFRHHVSLNYWVGLGRLSWSGVDLFFVLSGFLIGGILLDHRGSPAYFKTFYYRRAYRILPLYFLVVTMCWLASVISDLGWTPYGRMELFKGRIPWWAFFTLTQNWWMAATGSFSRAGLSVTWSLAIEEQFYLVLPFVVRRLSSKTLVYFVVGVVLGVPLIRALVILLFSHGSFAAYVLPPCRADALGLGVLCAILVRKPDTWDYLLAHRTWLYIIMGFLLLCVGTFTFQAYPLFTDVLYGLEYTLLALFYSSILLIAVTREDRFVQTAFCNKFLRKLGAIAYGTYLLHYIFIGGLSFLLASLTTLSPTVIFIGAPVLGVAVTIVIADISWRLFERPLVRRGHAYNF